LIDKRIVLGVSGSIAAFKAAKLASDLVQASTQVRVVLTSGGARFVSALTFAALTGHDVAGDTWDEQPGRSRMGHLELARWADILVVAPASAHSIAGLALGLSDTLLGAVALSTTAPLLVAPAMETHMYRHAATQQHLHTLRERGATMVGPESGHLASGAEGAGRMSEPDVIRSAVLDALGQRQDLEGFTVLVTAGPTYEPIDPVRFIGNRSSGKMGYAIAKEAAKRSARVILVTGPTALSTPAGVDVIQIETTEQMRQAVLARVAGVDVVVMAAAVADFRPSTPSNEKLKRQEAISLQLSPTSDISAEVARLAPRAIHVGFALESADLLTRTRDKLNRKKIDLVVANEISAEHNPFGADTNRVAIVSHDGVEQLGEMSKREVAVKLWDVVLARLRPA